MAVDPQTKVVVEALGNIYHGAEGEAVKLYEAGEKIEVKLREAAQLVEAEAVKISEAVQAAIDEYKATPAEDITGTQTSNTISANPDVVNLNQQPTPTEIAQTIDETETQV